MNDKPFPLLTAKDINAMSEKVHVHQFNENAIRNTRSISDHLGLKTMGVHLVRLEPGRESTQYHLHHKDEEFIYILSGQGIAEIDDREIAVGPGDFMAFGQKSLPHCLRNDSEEDLTYLMGGTRSEVDICDYPRINRRMYRIDGRKEYTDMDDLHDVP